MRFIIIAEIEAVKMTAAEIITITVIILFSGFLMTFIVRDTFVASPASSTETSPLITILPSVDVLISDSFYFTFLETVCPSLSITLICFGRL